MEGSLYSQRKPYKYLGVLSLCMKLTGWWFPSLSRCLGLHRPSRAEPQGYTPHAHPHPGVLEKVSQLGFFAIQLLLNT